MTKVTLFLILAAVLYGAGWYFWTGMNRAGIAGSICFQTKKFSWDCGGEKISADCLKWQDKNWDDNKRCLSGKDCCSGICLVINENKNICVENIDCSSQRRKYIDDTGEEREVDYCYRRK